MLLVLTSVLFGCFYMLGGNLFPNQTKTEAAEKAQNVRSESIRENGAAQEDTAGQERYVPEHTVSGDAGKTDANAEASVQKEHEEIVLDTEEAVQEYLSGSEVVYGVRSSRKTDTFFKRTTAEGFYKFLNAMGAEVVFNHADYRLISAKVLKEFANFKEVNLFLRGMVPLVGFKSSSVYYERKERFAGETHYPLKKMLALAIDGITSLSVKPLRMISSLGFFMSVVSILGLIWAIVAKILGFTEAGWASIVAAICLLSSIQLICLGIIGEYIGKIYMEVKERPRYIISERTEDHEQK